MKTEERNHVVQSFQPYIPPTVQTPPTYQGPTCVPNPVRLMTTRFSPLDLPVVLHDLPQNYAQKIPFYDGDGNFIARQHVDIKLRQKNGLEIYLLGPLPRRKNPCCSNISALYPTNCSNPSIFASSSLCSKST